MDIHIMMIKQRHSLSRMCQTESFKWHMWRCGGESDGETTGKMGEVIDIIAADSRVFPLPPVFFFFRFTSHAPIRLPLQIQHVQSSNKPPTKADLCQWLRLPRRLLELGYLEYDIFYQFYQGQWVGFQERRPPPCDRWHSLVWNQYLLWWIF